MIQSVMVGKARKRKKKEGKPSEDAIAGILIFWLMEVESSVSLFTGYEGVVGSGGRGVLVMSHCWKPSTDIHHAVYKILLNGN